MTVFNLGSINLDYFYRLPHLVTAGETLAANDYVQAGFAHYNSASSQLYTSSFGGHLIG